LEETQIFEPSKSKTRTLPFLPIAPRDNISDQ